MTLQTLQTFIKVRMLLIQQQISGAFRGQTEHKSRKAEEIKEKKATEAQCVSIMSLSFLFPHLCLYHSSELIAPVILLMWVCVCICVNFFPLALRETVLSESVSHPLHDGSLVQ